MSKSQATVHTLSLNEVFAAALAKFKDGDRKAFTTSEVIEYIESQVSGLIERGDIVDVPHPEDNEIAIRWIYSGPHYIAFTTDIPEDSDCDAIPEEFKVISEFPIHYWSKTNLGGTCYGCDDVNFDHTPYIEEICDNLSIRLTKAVGASLSSFFHVDEQMYIIEFDTGFTNIIDKDKFTAAQVAADLHNILTGFSEWAITFAAKPCDGYSNEELEKMVSSNTLFAHFHMK